MRILVTCVGFFFLYLNRKLTKVLKTYVDNAEKCGITDQLFKAMKALEYIFKFIVRSRILFNQWVQAVLKPPIAKNAPKLPKFYSPAAKIARYCTVLEILETVRSYFPVEQRCEFSVAVDWWNDDWLGLWTIKAWHYLGRTSVTVLCFIKQADEIFT